MPNTTSEKTTDKYWEGLYWVLVSVVFRIVIGIGSSIIFVRYLGDEGYGAVIVMADFVTLASVICSMGLGVAQTRVLPQLFVQNEYAKAKDVIIRTIAIRVGLSLLTAILLYNYSPFLLNHLYRGISKNLLIIALTLLPIQMFVFCLRGILEVTFHQKRVSMGNIYALLVRLGCVLPVILLDLGIIWFFLTQLLADLYLLFFYGRCFFKSVWPKIKNVKRQKYTGKIFSLGIVMMVTLLSNRFLGKEMDTQILSYFLQDDGLKEIAIYSISYMLVFRALSFVGVGSGSVSNLSQSIISELLQKNQLQDIQAIYESQIQIFYFISIPLIFGAFVFAERIIISMYGESFAGSGQVCTILFVGLGGTVINYINFTILYAFGKENKLLICRTVFGGLNVALSVALAFKGAWGVATATGVCLFGIAIFESYLVQKLIRPKFPWIFGLKMIAGSMVMAISCVEFFGLQLDISHTINLIFGVLIGLISFVVIMFILKPIDQEVIENLPDSIGLLKILKVLFVHRATNT